MILLCKTFNKCLFTVLKNYNDINNLIFDYTWLKIFKILAQCYFFVFVIMWVRGKTFLKMFLLYCADEVLTSQKLTLIIFN